MLLDSRVLVPVVALLGEVEVEWVAPRGTPGLLAVDFRTPTGTVRL